MEGVKAVEVVCRCSKIMSPHNCNEILSPSQDGDDKSERVSAGEGAFERAPGTAAQAPLSARLYRPGAAWQSRARRAVGGFASAEAVDPNLGPGQGSGLQRFPFHGKTLRRRGAFAQPRDRARHPAGRETVLSAEAPLPSISRSPPVTPEFRHDGAHRRQ